MGQGFLNASFSQTNRATQLSKFIFVIEFQVSIQMVIKKQVFI